MLFVAQFVLLILWYVVPGLAVVPWFVILAPILCYVAIIAMIALIALIAA